MLESSVVESSAFLGELGPILLRCIQTEYPNGTAHVLTGPDDARTPRQLHPAFYGCYDWHSAVHSHWALTRLISLGLAVETFPALERHLTRDNVLAEQAYLEIPGRSTFERPYGLAWLLTLASELRGSGRSELGILAENLRPFENVIVDRLGRFLPVLTRPDQRGLHGNTAFSLGLIFDYADVFNPGLSELVEVTARRLYDPSRRARLAEEAGPSDFLTPALVEADLMRRLLPASEFADWLGSFLREEELMGLKPEEGFDHFDTALCHLDGLNLSRAWCLRRLANALGPAHPWHALLAASAEAHAEAGLAHVISGDFTGEHWLPSFAVYLLTDTH